jgi:hypothetical protein
MRCVYKPSLSLNICITGWCYTTSGRLAQKSIFRPSQRHTSSSSCTSLGFYLVFSDIRILSRLEDPSYLHPLHINSIVSLRIYLHVNVHSLDVSPHHSEVTMTMWAARRHNRAFWSGSEILSLPRKIDDMMKELNCRSAAQR